MPQMNKAAVMSAFGFLGLLPYFDEFFFASLPSVNTLIGYPQGCIRLLPSRRLVRSLTFLHESTVTAGQ